MRTATASIKCIQQRSFATATSQQVPNRFTQVYSRMKSDACPEAIRAYSACVATVNEEGDLVKGSCQEEFAAVKECFRNVRNQMREGTL